MTGGFLFAAALVITLVVIVFSVWLLKKCAERLGAGLPTVGRCFGAMLAATIILGLLDFVIANHFGEWFMRLGFYIVLPSYLYGKLLEMPFSKGLIAHAVVTVGSCLFSLFFIVVLYFFGFFPGLGGLAQAERAQTQDVPNMMHTYVQITKLKDINDKLCSCIEEVGCVFAQQAKYRKVLTALQEKSYPPEMQVKIDAIEEDHKHCLEQYDTVQKRVAAWEKQLAEQKKRRHENRYKTIASKDLTKYIDKTILLDLTDGTYKSGVLMDVTKYYIKLHEFYGRGDMIVPISLRKIKRIRIEQH